MKISKKVLLIIILALLLAALAGLAYFMMRQKDESPAAIVTVDNNKPIFVQEFMSVDEKKALSMPDDLRVQIIKRDSAGEPMTFKIINSDEDILTSDSIPAIRPEKE